MNVDYRKVILIILIGAVVSLAIAGVNEGFLARLTANKKQERAFVPKIVSLAEAIQMINKTNCVVIDVRESKYYTFSHIPRAISLPASHIRDATQATLQALREAKTVLIYCDGASCGSSMMAARLLGEGGITNSAVYFQGFLEWNACDLPLEKTGK